MIKLSEMMPDFQKKLTVIRAGEPEFIRGKVFTGEGISFKTLAFYTPTRNNLNSTSQGIYSFSQIDIYTEVELLLDDGITKIADRVLINGKKYKIIATNNFYSFFMSMGEIEK